MTKARILADYVAGGTTAAEFDVLDGLTSTTAELNYVDGVTSNVQTQLDAKAPTASPTFTGNFTSVGIDDNADATAITIGSDEKVQIGGTSYPSYGTLRISGNQSGGASDPNGTIEFTEGTTVWNSIKGFRESSGGSLEFLTRPDNSSAVSTKMTITNDGKVGIGETGPDGILHVRGDTDPVLKVHMDTADNKQAIIIKHDRASGSTNSSMIVFVDAANGDSGIISSNGSNTAYGVNSDYRKKENVVPMTGAITRLQALKPSRFNFIAQPGNTIDGFLAHEAQEVVPEAVIGEKDAIKPEVLYTADDDIPEGKKVGDVKIPETISSQSIDQSKIVPLLVGALQEAITRIEALESE